MQTPVKVAGVTFANPDNSSRQHIISELKPHAPLVLVREPDNKYDIYAVAVLDGDGRQFGYIPKTYSQIVSGWLNAGEVVKASVHSTMFFKSKWSAQILLEKND